MMFTANVCVPIVYWRMPLMFGATPSPFRISVFSRRATPSISTPSTRVRSCGMSCKLCFVAGIQCAIVRQVVVSITNVMPDSGFVPLVPVVAVASLTSAALFAMADIRTHSITLLSVAPNVIRLVSLNGA